MAKIGTVTVDVVVRCGDPMVVSRDLIEILYAAALAAHEDHGFPCSCDLSAALDEAGRLLLA